MHATIASIYVGSGGKLKCLRGKYSTDRAVSQPHLELSLYIYYAYVCLPPVRMCTVFVQCLWRSEDGVNHFPWIWN